MYDQTAVLRGDEARPAAGSDFIQILVTEEIRRIVAEAIETGSIVSAAAVAEQVSRPT